VAWHGLKKIKQKVETSMVETQAKTAEKEE